ncbi:MAG: KAP family P-loop NTPase fold protein [Clostridium chrysemydis]|uniref:KAP family P-loop NTPase fold protein n=1 Tax=Clostridium chrysemydis TaxID=2665504 RepID=UPI003F387D5F
MEKKLSFENDDILGRRKIAENISRIIENSDEFNVIAIDSSWGTGKTTFIKKWETMLHSEEYQGKFKTLYFNAWKNDYMKDPFAALLTAIDNEDSELKESFKSAVTAGIGITKGVTDILLKLATAGAIGTKEFKNIKEEFFKGIKEESFKGIKEEQTARDNFIEEIEKIASEGPKTIFFIDEIDRCRPTFAIELLETIKHLFSAKNIYFIISVDKIQLSHSIKSLYGEGMDADGYLRRFFDLEFAMPIDLNDYISNKAKSINNIGGQAKLLIELLSGFMVLERYSLRDIDKTYEYMKLLIPNLTNNDRLLMNISGRRSYFVAFICSYLINLKMKHSETYNKIINKNFASEEIDDIVKIVNIDDSKDIHSTMSVYFNMNTVTSEFVKKYLVTLKEFNVEEDDMYNEAYIVNKINLADLIYRLNFHENIISLLEILDSFKVNV